MKTLYFVRHAKSSWDNPELQDIERPLLEKGKKRTKKMIDYLMSKNVQIDLMISSHARRALDTAHILSHAFQYPEDKIKIYRMIYSGTEQQIANQLFDMPQDVNHLWIIGHNPTITNFANIFLKEKIDYLQTSGVVSISFPVDSWDKLSGSDHKVNFVMYPRKLKQLYNNK
ncbi:MAG: histidine phosphatase family protein [Bacteroidales bacterium]|nr:histidine phosphatase family protein [Bacteroidales bacterium]